MRQMFWRAGVGLSGVALVASALCMVVGSVIPGGVLAFDSNRHGNYEILLTDINRRILLNVTDHPGQDRNPSWSPDGRRLVFESYSGQRIVTRVRQPTNTIFTVMLDRRTGENRGASPALPPSLRAQEPVWSPDGTMIAFSGSPTQSPNNDLYVVSAYDGDVQRVTNTEDLFEHSPAWSPSGDLLTYGVFFPDTGQPEAIYLTPYERFVYQLVQLRPSAGGVQISDQVRATSPSWTPAGQILFVSRVRGSDQLTLTDPSVDAYDMPLIEDGVIPIESPVMSPDGAWIAFSSASTVSDGWRSLYVMRLDGTGLRQITFGGNGFNQWRDANPAWRPLPG